MRHIIVTRLGIGINRPSFYDVHISLLEKTIFQSLKSQTCTEFEWVIAIDSRIDSYSLERLQDLLCPFNNFRIITVDPLATYSLNPGMKAIVGSEIGDTRLAMSRIDDDDAVSVDFVATVKKIAPSCGPAVIAFEHGIEIMPEQNTGGRVTHDSIAIGLTVISDEDDPINIYSQNHRKWRERMNTIGGSYILSQNKDAYIHVRWGNSDSHEGKKIRKKANELLHTDILLEEVSYKFGIQHTWIEDIKYTMKSTNDTRAPLVYSDVPRLNIKREILRAFRSARNEGNDKLSSALASAFYAI